MVACGIVELHALAIQRLDAQRVLVFLGGACAISFRGVAWWPLRPGLRGAHGETRKRHVMFAGEEGAWREESLLKNPSSASQGGECCLANR